MIIPSFFICIFAMSLMVSACRQMQRLGRWKSGMAKCWTGVFAQKINKKSF